MNEAHPARVVLWKQNGVIETEDPHAGIPFDPFYVDQDYRP